MVHLSGRTSRRLLCALLAVAAIGLFAAPISMAAPTQTAPPPTLPPPPVTVQQVVNQLLPLIRQLDPITQQVGPLLGQLDPLFEAGGESSAQFKAVGAQLEPVLAPAGLAMAALGEALEPLFASLDEQVSPQLQDLLALLGPYINQVDLATAFQVIGPLAPTAVKTIPTLNTFYDGIDSITGQLLNPVSCPLARAVPQQKLLNIVVPFLCYDTLDVVEAIGGMPPADPVVPAEPAGSGPSPDVGPPAAVSPPPVDSPVLGNPSSLPSLGSIDSTGSTAAPRPAAGTPRTAVPDAIQQINSGDDRVEALEDRMRLMMILGAGLGLLLWSFFRPVAGDGGSGLGAFRKPRTGPAPSLQ
jgi:hypothetical protein